MNEAKDMPEVLPEYLEHRGGGNLFWKKKPAPCVRVGSRAGSIHKSTGYIDIKFRGKNYRAHRVVYFLEYGWCPEFVDHIDGDRQHNDPSNLRAVSHQQNLTNTKMYSSNTSGFKGVFREGSKWRASITVNYRSIKLGLHEDIESAIADRQRAEINYFAGR